MKLAVVVQARMGSSRLPGKVNLPVAGAPLLVRMLERVLEAKTPFELVLATTTDSADDLVAELGTTVGVRVTRGHPTDLLARHLQAAHEAGADVVAKIPSDCPLIDPAVIDRVLGYYVAERTFDFVSNLHPATYPDGNDVEVFSTELLELANREARKPLERVHTTPFFWEQPERFRLGNVLSEGGGDRSMSHRFTIDYPEDYAFVRAVYDSLWTPSRPIFSLADILDLLKREPHLLALNARYAGVNWYRNHLSELKTVSAAETRSPSET